MAQPLTSDPGRRPTTTSDRTSAGAIPRGVSVANQRTTDEFGEAYLVWRCLDCGETGDLEAFPSECPNCGAGREDLYYWTED
ncbi:DUF7130 family rubredoxin-like protein [Halegenticoccus tardaugens]|uniref:DUF7130 family rubredoxin-like protein n=1 Tax=Halegenticoccus tardaugens TaxID=2071624 RepID=UPI00100B54E7|nr:hypothetical protein [Halegenticoccus tardaugens]